MTEETLETRIDPTNRKSVTTRLIAAALALIGEIKVMQSDEPDWFEGFSEWSVDTVDDGGADTMAIQWPNLAIVLEQLEAAIQAVKDLIDAERTADIQRLTLELIEMEKGKAIEHG